MLFYTFKAMNDATQCDNLVALKRCNSYYLSRFLTGINNYDGFSQGHGG